MFSIGWHIRQARSIIGDDALLMVDMNEGSTVRDAVALAHRVAEDRIANGAPVITTQPESRNVNVGDAVTLNVAAPAGGAQVRA